MHKRCKATKLVQIADLIQGTSSATCAIPHALLAKLIRCPTVIASLRGQISGTPAVEDDDPSTAWTASLGTSMTDAALPAEDAPSAQVNLLGETAISKTNGHQRFRQCQRAFLLPIDEFGLQYNKTI